MGAAKALSKAPRKSENAVRFKGKNEVWTRNGSARLGQLPKDRLLGVMLCVCGRGCSSRLDGTASVTGGTKKKEVMGLVFFGGGVSVRRDCVWVRGWVLRRAVD